MTGRFVISLGGNAFMRPDEPLTMAGQFRFATRTLEPLSQILNSDAKLLVTHGNGPQVGFILTRVERALGDAYNLPLEVCVAESEGELGYVLQQTLYNLCHHARRAVTLLTQVKVNRTDPAFATPTKPIGPVLDQLAADRLQSQGLDVGEVPGGFRRVVPSPMPREIIEMDIIGTLLDAGTIVIAAGGGGIPVIDTDEGIQGVEAVVDKDFATALLARELGADVMVMVTNVAGAYRDFGSAGATLIEKTTTEELRTLLNDGHFPAGSMGPKVGAAIEFTEATGKPTIICQPADLASALELEAGTRVLSRE